MTMLGHPSAAEGRGPGTMAGPLDVDQASPAVTKRRHRWPKVVAVLLVVLLAAGGAAWYVVAHHHDSATPAAAATTEQVVQVTSGTITDSVTAQGTVAAQDTEDLNFTSGGTVTAVKVKVGDTVKAGQTLATIDSRSLDSDLVAAGATRDQAAAKLSDDQSAAASEAQIAADLSSLAVAQDSVAQAWAALGGASLVSPINGTITAANLTVGEQLASNGTGGTSLTGSRSGSGASSATLGSSQAQQGGANQGSNSSTSQIEVVSTGKFEVNLAVDSADIAKVKDGQAATLTVSTSDSTTNTGAGGFAGRFPAGLFGNGGFGGFGGNGQSEGQATTRNGATGGSSGFGQGGNAAATGTGTGQNGAGRTGTGRTGIGQNGTTPNGTGRRQAAAGTVATGTVTDVSKLATASNGVANYTVTVDFTGDPTKIFIGSSVSGEIATTEHTGLLVPVRAVTTSAQGPTVKVALDGTANGRTATQAVTTGATTDGMIEITAGLQAGERVIVELPARFGNFGGGAFPFGGQGSNNQGANNQGSNNQGSNNQGSNATSSNASSGGSGG